MDYQQSQARPIPHAAPTPAPGPNAVAGKLPVAERRARLVVAFACELLGLDPAKVAADLYLPISVAEFEAALRARFAATYPNLIYRTDSTLERARLERTRLPQLPRVVLRRGAPPRSATSRVSSNPAVSP